MEEKEMREFSWTALFLVTSFCFFAFSAALKFLGDYQNGLFVWIGSISFILGILSWGVRSIPHRSKNRHDLTS